MLGQTSAMQAEAGKTEVTQAEAGKTEAMQAEASRIEVTQAYTNCRRWAELSRHRLRQCRLRRCRMVWCRWRWCKLGWCRLLRWCNSRDPTIDAKQSDDGVEDGNGLKVIPLFLSDRARQKKNRKHVWSRLGHNTGQYVNVLVNKQIQAYRACRPETTHAEQVRWRLHDDNLSTRKEIPSESGDQGLAQTESYQADEKSTRPNMTPNLKTGKKFTQPWFLQIQCSEYFKILWYHVFFPGCKEKGLEEEDNLHQ